METETKDIGFADKFTAALTLIGSLPSIIVKTAQDHAAAEEKLKAARKFRNDLDVEYKQHPIIVEAKRIQKLKTELDFNLEAFIKSLKNGQMLTYERAEEEERQAEERRIAAEIKKKADAEARVEAERVRVEAEKARKIAEAEQKKRDDEARAAAEVSRKEAEAARKRAEAARRRGDEEAAAKAEVARKEAEATRKATEEARKKAEAEAAALAEVNRKESEAEQERIKQEAAEASANVTVVVEKSTPTAKRREIFKFRMKSPEAVKPEYLMPDEVKIGKVVRALGKLAEGAVGGIEVYAESV